MKNTLEGNFLEKRRNRIDIIAEILRLCLRGEKATHVIYKSNLNFKRFQAYVRYLLNKGFLEVIENINGSKMYRTTEKGRQLLKLIEEE